MALLRQATRLRRTPATKRALQSPEVVTLNVPVCGRLRIWRQPHRGVWRDLKTVTVIACRALVSAVQKYLSSRPIMNEETFLFLTTLLDSPSNSRGTIPRSVRGPFHTLVSTCTTTALQGIVSRSCDRWCQTVLVLRIIEDASRSPPTLRNFDDMICMPACVKAARKKEAEGCKRRQNEAEYRGITMGQGVQNDRKKRRK